MDLPKPASQAYAIGGILPSEYDEATKVWEASVRASHDFLTEKEILTLKGDFRQKWLYNVRLYSVRDRADKILGLMGVSADKIEMLFIHPDHWGQGLGKALVHMATRGLGLRKVDVNEANRAALGFYLALGFCVTDRSETDSIGWHHPLLLMELPPEPLPGPVPESGFGPPSPSGSAA
jgi:putative acetyltransferase